MKRDQDHFRGCLLGGAVGDALGAPVEFLLLDEIKEQYGEPGVTDLFPGTSGKAEVTDDTQMTLFTAEGILRAAARGKDRGYVIRRPSFTTRICGGYIRRGIQSSRGWSGYTMGGS